MKTAEAIEGATIVKEYQGAVTNVLVYKQRCEACGYIPPGPPIRALCLPGGTVMYGFYHAERFVCPFCGIRQEVRIQG